jgi:hypothetical protein
MELKLLLVILRAVDKSIIIASYVINILLTIMLLPTGKAFKCRTIPTSLTIHAEHTIVLLEGAVESVLARWRQHNAATY